MVPLFVFTSFLTASLLFVVQPMVGRMVLPAFGGAPQVWTTSMLFFQVALLFGYGYTHLTTTRLSPRVQPWLHLAVALVPMAVLPIVLTVSPSGEGGLSPSFELLGALTTSVAAPFILIATSGPLVQRWFSWTNHPRAHDPYFLYAAGNVGSAAGLFAYPFVLEPTLTLDQQSLLWAGGYLLALLLLVACALTVRIRRAHPVDPRLGAATTYPSEQPKVDPQAWRTAGAPDGLALRRIARWLLLAFIPSSLMLAVTTLITTDIAAVPMLWIVPLGVYLLTFTVAFSAAGPKALRWATLAGPLVIVLAIAVRPIGSPIVASFAVQVLLVLVGGTIAHGLLAADRPPPRHLTRFYLVVAVGGALGGLFNSLLAPVLFPTVLEYGVTVTLLLGLLIAWRQPVAGAEGWGPGRRLPAMLLLATIPIALYLLLGTAFVSAPLGARAAVALVLALPLLTRFGTSGTVGLVAALLVMVPQLLPLATSELIERTFFGVHQIEREGGTLQLIHGNTVHGAQDLSSDEARRQAISYYHAEQPLGDVMSLRDDPRTVSGIGLGAGAMAAYGRPGDRFTFYEIDPAVADIAWNSFSYLDDSAADIAVVIGDGRLTLAQGEVQNDILVIDAFTSDAIPVHLLTLEAFEMYLGRLDQDGVIAVHISNRHLDLRPVLAATAVTLDLHGLVGTGDGKPDGAQRSTWVALARSPTTLAALRSQGWEELPEDGVLWTDQRSSLLPILTR